MQDIELPVGELTKLRDEVRAYPDRLPLSLALAFDMGVKAAQASHAAEAAQLAEMRRTYDSARDNPIFDD